MNLLMITSMLVAQAQSQQHPCIGADYLEDRGFDVEVSRFVDNAPYPHFSLGASHASRCRLLVDCDLFRRDVLVTAVELQAYGAYERMNSRIPSGLPIGSDLRYKLSPNRLHLITASDSGRVQLTMMAPTRTDEQGSAIVENYDWSKIDGEVVLEKYMRVVVGRLTAHHFGSASNVNAGGAVVSGFKSRDGKRLLGNVSDWAKKRGWSWTDDPRGFATLRKGTDWAVLPLGAGKIKINGEWQDLPDLIAEKDGDWYLSASGLSALGGA